MIPGVGIHTMTAAEYHADPCERPSLSSSIAKILVTASPAHAWTAHPKLNPDYEPTDDSKYDLGTTVHALLLQGEDVAVIVDAPDWRTKAAQTERDAARAVGQVPLLTKDWDRARRMVEAVRSRLSDFNAHLLTSGKPEQTMVWQEGNAWCRSLIDWLANDYTAVCDLKTTSRSANPEAWTRSSMLTHGFDMQAAFHSRGVQAVTDVMPEWRWIVAETSPPFAVSVISPGPDVLTLAEAKVERAIQLWRDCLTNDSWPGYPARVATAELPGWAESQWMEQEAHREEVAA